jgi:hypothetical protein
MKKNKPLNLLDNKGFWPEKGAILDGLREVLTLGECEDPPAVRDFGTYRGVKWRDENDELVPYQSVDWYVYNAMDEERLQVDASRLLESFCDEPWRQEHMIGDHYDLFVMEEDMFDPDADEDGEGTYAVGRARRFMAAVISTHRIDHIWGMPYSYLKTEAMRQICAMFGLPGEQRERTEQSGSQTFCTNRCILQHADDAPEDWQTLTEIRIKEGPLCEECLRELNEFFAEVEAEHAEQA